MSKLFRYLKPFTVMIVAAVALLFVQAMCDLGLPNYMSDIVNVGIQNSGIDHASPDILSKNGMQLMQLFMNEKEIALVEDAYTSEISERRDSLSDEVQNTTQTVELRDVSNEQKEDLDSAFGSATTRMLTFLNSMGTEANTTQSEANMENIDMEEIYKMLPMLAAIPQEQRVPQTQSSDLEASLSTQTASVMTSLFYQELGMDLDEIQMQYILSTGLKMLGISLLGVIAAVSVGFLASRIGAGFARGLRKDLFEKVESFSAKEFDRFSSSSLITRTTNDITQVQMVIILGIRMLAYAPIMGIGGLIMIMGKNTSMTWTLAVALVLLFALIGVIMKVAMPRFRIMQKLIDRINLVARENLSGLLVVRAFGSQEFEKNRFDQANRDLTANSLFVNRVITVMMPAMMLIMNTLTLLIVWVGGHQIADANMMVGDLMAFIQYAMQIIMAFLMISMIFIMVPRASACAQRINEVLQTKPSIEDPLEPKPFQENMRGVVEFKDVSFRYDNADEYVISHVSFTAKPGETVAFIGSTGSGKSTLINLIPRFYDVSEGAILVNGVDVREVKQHDLHEQIGYVAQKGILMSGTIAENIAYGNLNADLSEIKQFAQIAQAEEFIESKENGYQDLIAQGGANVSGGQKQRLSIARALATKAPIYIFDDSFSALDFKTDAKLRNALHENLSDATLLIVAQRVSTIMHADQILVLDEGKVVGKGTHEELLKTCPTYYEIASSQLSKEEL